MTKKSLGRRARQIAGGLVLGGFAVAAHAEPFTLEGTCSVVSLAVQGSHCQLTYQMFDDFTAPTAIRKGQIKVNGAVVHQYNNDTVTPAGAAIMAGSTQVACGAAYTVTAFIAPLQAGSVYPQVGSLPRVECPAQP